MTAIREVRRRSSRSGDVPAPLSQTSNSLLLIGAKGLSMGLGFVFWVIAARLFAAHDVGLAAGVVSAMMLCTQLALFGFGSAFITHYPRLQREPERLVSTSFTVVTVLGMAWSAAFVVLATRQFRELDVVARDPAFAAMFICASVFGTLGILFDQVATALRRGEQALIRNLAFSIATVSTLALLAVASGSGGAKLVFLPWAVAGLVGWTVGVRQLRRALSLPRLRLTVDRPLATGLIRAGLPNYVLTLADRSPGLVLPVIVAELLSPTANATWYTVWMMAWVVYIVPIQSGMTIFAEISHDPRSVGRSLRHGVRTALAIGAAGALVIGVAATPLLSILGEQYAIDGAGPLRMLVLGVFPLTFLQAYFSCCRARGRLSGAITTAWVTGGASVGAAAYGGVQHGLMGMAVAWLLVQSVAGGWALWRLRAVGAS